MKRFRIFASVTAYIALCLVPCLMGQSVSQPPSTGSVTSVSRAFNATVNLTQAPYYASGSPVTTTTVGSTPSGSTSATAGNGTATCSGTATIATVLGGAQGNLMNLNIATFSEEH